MKVSTAISILNLSKETYKNTNLNDPLGLSHILVFQGKEDLCCKAERTIEFFEGLNTNQKELILLDSKLVLIYEKIYLFLFYLI